MKEKNLIELGKKLFTEGMHYNYGSDLLAVYLFALNCKESKDFQTYNTILKSFENVCCLIQEWIDHATINIFPDGGLVTVWLMKGNNSVYSYTLNKPYQKREEIIKALDIIRASVF